MDPNELAERITASLPDGGARWLAEAGATSVVELLGRLPPRALAHDPLRTLVVLRDLSSQAGDHAVAAATGRVVVQLVTQFRGRNHEDVAFETAALGVVLDRAGDEEGLRLLQGAANHVQGVRGAVVRQHLGGALVRAGQLKPALAALEAAFAIRSKLAPDALLAAQVGEVLQKLGRTADALPYLEEAYARTREQEGAEAPRTLARAHLLGTAYNAVERFADAATLLRPVFAHLPADDLERRATVGFELGLALDRSGAEEEAIRRIDEAVRLTRQVGKRVPHVALANRLMMMAQIHLRRGRAAEAEGLYLEALDAERTLHGDASAEVAAQYAQLGHFCYRTGRPGEAAGWMDSATSLVETALGPKHPQTVAIADAHVALLVELADQLRATDPAQAKELLQHALEVGTRLLGHVHDRTRRAKEALERATTKKVAMKKVPLGREY